MRLFPELNSMVRKVMRIDFLIDSIVGRLGDLEQAYLIDDYPVRALSLLIWEANKH